MSTDPTNNTAPKISLKRKRAPVWPFATMGVLDRLFNFIYIDNHMHFLSCGFAGYTYSTGDNMLEKV
jgi:hypothetical protein